MRAVWGETGTDRFVDATTETEAELRLPLEVDMEPDRIRKDVPIYPGAVDMDAVGPDPETQRRFRPPNRAQPKWPRHRLPLPRIRNPVDSYRGPGTTGRFRRWSAHIRDVQPDVSGTGPTPTERRYAAGEANTRSACFRVTDPGTPESR